ncbi:kelch-like protein 17 [Oppia nitens]|uniref:kelch-like protein 17 n=1 Tax=Oppia nitens TaxID=1686743 RepID=UPI0023DC5790|nr:kelch-like protein 17 [Oppia nitens]
MSTKRQVFSLISIDSKLYAIGGWDGNYLNSVETYDTQTNQWKPIASMNQLRGYNDATVIDNTIYICGGRNNNISKSCEYYLPNTDEWSFTTPMIEERYGLALVSHDGLMYAIGGKSGNEIVDTMERLDTTTQQWQPMKHMRYPRYLFGSASFMGKIYVCGGVGYNDWKSCETYDPKTNKWTVIAPMLSTRYQFKLIAFNDKLYALGGYTNVIDGVIDTVETYDYKLNQWSYTTSLPLKMAGFGSRDLSRHTQPEICPTVDLAEDRPIIAFAEDQLRLVLNNITVDTMK